MEHKRNSLYLFGITLVAAIGGLLFGYDTAVISGAEESLKVYLIDSLHLGSFIHGATISSALIGCIIGGILSGFFASRFGRKNSLIMAAIFFLISSLGAAYPEFLFFSKEKLSCFGNWIIILYINTNPSKIKKHRPPVL